MKLVVAKTDKTPSRGGEDGDGGDNPVNGGGVGWAEGLGCTYLKFVKYTTDYCTI